MLDKDAWGAQTLSWIALAVLAATVVLLYVQFRQSRSLGAEVKEKLVTVESTMEFALQESLKQGKLERAASAQLFSVVVILDARGCAACIVSELAALNTYWDQLKGHTQVYYSGDTARYLEGREILFEYRTLSGVDELFGTDLGPFNPVSLLMARGQILDVRVSTPTNMYHEEVASAWYAGVSSLF